MDYSPLIAHLKLFALGVDRSVQWAKDAETLLDGLEPWDQLSTNSKMTCRCIGRKGDLI